MRFGYKFLVAGLGAQERWLRYLCSQADSAIAAILRSHFPKVIDLIVDDASHQYEACHATFHLSFSSLKPRGLYVL